MRQPPLNNANIYSTQEYGQPEDATYAAFPNLQLAHFVDLSASYLYAAPH